VDSNEMGMNIMSLDITLPLFFLIAYLSVMEVAYSSETFAAITKMAITHK
jgi:hypothetical protein